MKNASNIDTLSWLPRLYRNQYFENRALISFFYDGHGGYFTNDNC